MIVFAFSSRLASARWLASLTLLVFSLIAPAKAQVTVETDYATTTLQAELDAVVPGETTWFVFRQELDEGWHVYWRNPGDTGLPLEAIWELPEGFTAGAPVYPLPERMPVATLVNFGHHGEPVFLLPVTAPADAEPGSTFSANLTSTWLICEEICVPETGEFAVSLPIKAKASPNEAAASYASMARADQPLAVDDPAALFLGDDSLLLKASLPAALEGVTAETAFFFPDAEGLVKPAAAQQFAVEDGALVIGLEAGLGYQKNEVNGLSGVLVVNRDGERKGYQINASLGDGEAPMVFASKIASTASDVSAGGGALTAGGSAPNLFLLFVAAFFGGMILNIMPCVFPILFVKAASFVHAAQDQQGVIKRHGLIYGAGVVATFAALGGLLLLLRAGGDQLGWGFHLQSPIVVLFSAYVLFLVGLNLAGVFEVGEGLQDVGSGLAARGGDLGAFFTGVLAVFVAAPCIGPLLSAPVGAAVLLSPFAGMMIFVLMALGLAAPYVILSFSPALAAKLPKPGAWMGVFKQALSFPVFGAAAFFFWVLAQQVGATGLATALAGAVLVAAAAWLFELSKGSGRGAMVARALAAVAVLAVVIPGLGIEARSSEKTLATATFDPGMVEEETTKGRGVFVDFTAAWCVTCQVNKATIFSRDSFSDLLQDNNVVLMTADWTRRDPMITETLEEFGANGVPFYVYYPPEGEPEVLPLPLTEGAIRKAIES